MKYPQFTIDEILAAWRRRKRIFLFPFILIMFTCVAASFILPKKYESSTTIMIQKDEVLNPLISYTMAIAATSDNRLRDINEIIYSRPCIEALLDSLGLHSKIATLNDENKEIKKIRKNIVTQLQGSDSYTIHYYDEVPWRAQKAVKILSDYFIRTKLSVNNKRNELAVDFFENKLDQLRNKFEQSQQKFLDVIKQQVNQLPAGDREVYSNIDEYNSSIGTSEQRLENDQKALNLLQQYSPNNTSSISVLYQIPLLGVAYSADLNSMLKKYDDLSQKYTPMYPNVQNERSQISDLAVRMETAIKTEIQNLRSNIWQSEQQRNSAISTIKEATLSQNQNGDVKSTYDIYQKLFDDMKIKLEQAKTTRDLDKNDAQQYDVIDPPQLPTSPAKPNKLLLIGGGIFLGIFMGLLSAGLTELFDTRIRTNKDVEVYDKPILAYLPAHNQNFD